MDKKDQSTTTAKDELEAAFEKKYSPKQWNMQGSDKDQYQIDYNNNIKSFIFSEILPSVLKEVMPEEVKDKDIDPLWNEWAKGEAVGRNVANDIFKQKAKEKYGIEL